MLGLALLDASQALSLPFKPLTGAGSVPFETGEPTIDTFLPADPVRGRSAGNDGASWGQKHAIHLQIEFQTYLNSIQLIAFEYMLNCLATFHLAIAYGALGQDKLAAKSLSPPCPALLCR
jgi:hypothetical protein